MPGAQQGAEVPGPAEQVVALEHVHRGQGGRRGDRVAAEGRAVLAAAEQAGHVGAVGDGRADGDAAAEALGQGDDVGAHARVGRHGVAQVVGLLPGQPRPGPPGAGLDLVEDEQGAVLAGEPADGGQVAGGGGADAALALHGLEHDRGHRAGGLVGEGRGHGVDVAEGHVLDAARQRLERLAVGGGRGERERAHGPAVEPALRRRRPGSGRCGGRS